MTNQQLISWIKNPVPIDQMQSAFPCVPPPVSPGNVEVCDGLQVLILGIDNDGDGVVDNGLTDSCNFDANGSWNSCYGCPTAYPNASNASPSKTGAGASRKLIPADGCPGVQVWDNVKGVCVDVKRVAVKSRSDQGLPGTGGASGKNSAGYNLAARFAVFVAVLALLLI